jgi:hypothetical protein
MSRRSAVLSGVVIVVMVSLAVGFWMTRSAGDRRGIVDLLEVFPTEEKLELAPATFQDLPGWREDAVEEALPALLRSCQRIGALADGDPVSGQAFAGTAITSRSSTAAGAGTAAIRCRSTAALPSW